MVERVKHRFITCSLLICILSALAVAGCVPEATTPMATHSFTGEAAQSHRMLIVFLPGKGDGGERFLTEGFVDAVRKTGVPADMMAVDAHLGYYLERTLPTRLKEDVITPARGRGYRQIWLVGISLGGFGALWYDIEHPGDVAGIVVLAPYLGERDLIDEIALKGGMTDWRPPSEDVMDDQHRIWKGLKQYERNEKNRGRMYLGYGRQDRFAGACGLLAPVLPAAQVVTVEGGHDWQTWLLLWNDILPRLPLASGETALKRPSLILPGSTSRES